MISPVALIVAALAFLGAGFIGALLLPKECCKSEKLVLGSVLGCGIVGMVFFALGVVQFWDPSVLIAVSVLLAVAGVWQLRLIPFVWGFSAAQTAALLVTGTILSITLMMAAAPVTDWDGLAYHLPVLQLWLKQGGFYFIPFIHHSNFPFLGEMLYAPAVASGNPQAAKVIHWMFFLFSTAMCGMIAARLFGKSTGAWAALAFAAMPIAIWESTVAYIDLTTTGFTLVSAYGMLRYLDGDNRDKKWLVVAALSAGFAAGTKTFALVWIALSAGWLLYSNRKNVKDIAVYLSIAILACGPWYIKSFVMTGNPVYPFLFSVFGGKGWDEAGAEMYRLSFTKFGAGRGLLEFFSLPFNFVVRGGSFIDGNIVMGSPGVILAALAPLAALRLRGRSLQLSLLLLVYLVIWFGLSQQTRYLLPVLALFSVVVTAAMVSSSWSARLAKSVTLLAGIVSVFICFALVQPVWKLMRGDLSESAYILNQGVNAHWILEFLDPKENVLLYGETRGFYLPNKYIWADIGLSTEIPYQTFDTPHEMLDWFRKNKWTVALINRRFASSDSRAIQLWDQAIREGLVKPYGGADYTHPQALDIELWQIP